MLKYDNVTSLSEVLLANYSICAVRKKNIRKHCQVVDMDSVAVDSISANVPCIGICLVSISFIW